MSRKTPLTAQEIIEKNKREHEMKKRLQEMRKKWRKNRKISKETDLEKIPEGEAVNSFEESDAGDVKIRKRKSRPVNPRRLDNDRESGALIDLQIFQKEALVKKATTLIQKLIHDSVQSNYKNTSDLEKNFLLRSACNLNIENVYIKSLLENGANPHHRDENGVSALQIASQAGNTRLTSILQKYSKEPTASTSPTSSAQNPLAQSSDLGRFPK